MPSHNLTDRFVAGLRPGAPGREEIADVKVPGLILRVGARTKTWYFVSRNDGPQRWLRLGRYPTLTLAAARKRARIERAKLDQGSDPKVAPAVAATTLPPDFAGHFVEQLARSVARAVMKELRRRGLAG